MKKTWLPLFALALSAPTLALPLRIDQGWSARRTNQVYHEYAGSQIMPLAWFLALELPTSQELLVDNARAYGLLEPRYKSVPAAGPLPVGFTVGDDEETGVLYGDKRWVGMNCAACHTAVLNIDGNEVVIEGAPSRIHLHKLQGDLAQAMRVTLDDPAKFARFRARQEPGKRANLRGYMERFVSDFSRHIRLNHSKDGRPLNYGPGRMDGKGGPVNEMVCNLERLGDLNLRGQLMIPSNCRDSHPPADIPYLWGMTENEWSNYTADAHSAFGRNLGAMNGGFGREWVEAGENGRPVFRSSVSLQGLVNIDRWYDELESPDWRKLQRLRLVPAIDADKAARGRRHYEQHCMGCHAIQPEFTPPNIYGYSYWRVGVHTPAQVGTDPGLVDAEYGRTAVLPESIVPWYKKDMGDDSVSPGNLVLASQYRKFTIIREIKDLFEREGLNLLDMLRASQCRDSRVQPVRGYRSRSLEGVIFTAPFLHNGSVPTLDDLMKPASQRPRTFRVGCRNYDITKMGYRCLSTAENGYIIDTREPGNSNAGHEYGTGLNAQERGEVIEFMKTLQMPQRPPEGPQAAATCGDL